MLILATESYFLFRLWEGEKKNNHWGSCYKVISDCHKSTLPVEEVIFSLVNSPRESLLALVLLCDRFGHGTDTLEINTTRRSKESTNMPDYSANLNRLILISQNNSTLDCMLFFKFMPSNRKHKATHYQDSKRHCQCALTKRHIDVRLTRPNIKDSKISLLIRDAVTGASVLHSEMLLHVQSLSYWAITSWFNICNSDVPLFPLPPREPWKKQDSNWKLKGCDVWS